MRIKGVEKLGGSAAFANLRVIFERNGHEVSKRVYLHTPVRLCTRNHRLSFMEMADRAAVEAHRDFLVRENPKHLNPRAIDGFNNRFPALAVEIASYID